MTERRTGLEILANLLSTLAEGGGRMRKYRLLSACQLMYSTPRWAEAVSKGLVAEEMAPSPNRRRNVSVATLTAKGRRALDAYRVLEAELA